VRKIALLLALLVSNSAWADSTEEAYRGADSHLLAQVRKGFETAPGSAIETRKLTELIDGNLPADLTDWPPIFLAYRAALEGLTGKHSLRPWVKYKRAKAGLAKLHDWVETYPDSIEIRMLRFSFCSQLPDFFEMRPLAEQDLAVLADLLVHRSDPMVSEEYGRNVVQWILQNGEPSSDERRRLESVFGPAD
jgi:hypothetical protein